MWIQNDWVLKCLNISSMSRGSFDTEGKCDLDLCAGLERPAIWNRREDCDEITGFAANIRPVYSPSRFKKTWRVLVRADRLWQALAVCSLIIRCLWPRPLTLARPLSQSPPAGLPGRPRHPLHAFPCELTSKTLRGHGHIPSLPWSSLTTTVHYDITLSSQRNGNRLPQQPPLYPFIPTVQGALVVPQNHSDL